MRRYLALGLGLLLGAAGSAGQSQPPPPIFEQRIGDQLPLETMLRDEAGRARALGSIFHGRPVLVIFGYYRCPQLCSVVQRGVTDALSDLKPTVGRDFDVAYLSIDPTDTPADARAQRAAAVHSYGRGGSVSGWHYLTGPGVARVAAAAGFHYRYDRLTRFYVHPAGFLVATPGGVVSRYFIGVSFAPADLAAAIRRAGRGDTGEPVANVILECFLGDGIAGRYGRAIWLALQISVGLTVAGLFGGIGWMLWDERRGRAAR